MDEKDLVNCIIYAFHSLRVESTGPSFASASLTQAGRKTGTTAVPQNSSRHRYTISHRGTHCTSDIHLHVCKCTVKKHEHTRIHTFYRLLWRILWSELAGLSPAPTPHIHTHTHTHTYIHTYMMCMCIV